MTKKQKKIVQCPFCDSNLLYFRRGLVSDVLISMLLPVRSYTCGSCSRSFRRFGNYFTSRQALIHILCVLAIIAFINPQLLLPKNLLLQEEQVTEETVVKTDKITDITAKEELPLLSMTIANATNSTFSMENGTLAITAVNGTTNASQTNVTQTETIAENATTKTILAFNGTDVSNSTAAKKNSGKVAEKATEPVKQIQGLQQGKLESIYFKEVKGKTRISLDLGGAPLSYTSFFLKDPNRLVVDIHGKWDYFGPTVLKPENPIFSRFRIGIYEDKIRMVMDLKGQTPAPVIAKTANGLDIDVK
jgi:DNA-directed RNA polymerase subunit RPC12/RpoP